MTDKIGVTELNEIILNIMPNSWSKKAYVQGFYGESTTLKKAINIFEGMEISESIYKGVVELSYKNPPQQTPTVLVTVGIREEKPPCHGLASRRVRALTSAENEI